MSGDRDRVILAEIIARCWQDSTFADELVGDPITKLREAGMGIPEGKVVKVFRSNDKVIYLGLSHGMKPEEYMQFASAHLAPLLPIPEGVELRLIQSTPTYMPIVIPAPPKQFVSGQLSDAELSGVAGGSGYLATAINVASSANAVAEANAAVVANAAGATNVVAAAEAVAVIAVVLI